MVAEEQPPDSALSVWPLPHLAKKITAMQGLDNDCLYLTSEKLWDLLQQLGMRTWWRRVLDCSTIRRW